MTEKLIGNVTGDDTVGFISGDKGEAYMRPFTTVINHDGRLRK